MSRNRRWAVYLLRCCDDSLYCGVSTDVVRRVREHRAGRGSKYVASRLPCTPVYIEIGHDRSSALKREHQVKSMSKRDKERMVQ